MGCGESKHSVGIENTISKSRSRKQGKEDVISTKKLLNEGNVTADAVSRSSISNLKKNGSKGIKARIAEISKKMDGKERGKEVEAKPEAADIAAAPESKEGTMIEKTEEVEADEEEREEAAAAVAVQGGKEEIKNEEEGEFVAADVEVVEEKKDEIKNEEVKADQEEREEVVALAPEVADGSSAVEEEIFEGENERKDNEENEEGNDSEELAPVEETKQPSAEEKTSDDQNV